MYYRDPKCVFVADTMELAQVIATWLGGLDIPAEVMNEMTMGGFEGLTLWLPGKASLRGIEVWVTNPDDAERARQLVAERGEEIAKAEAARAARTGTIDVVCEECGKTSSFPAADEGKIENCPHCGAFVDIPGPNDEMPEEESAGEPQ